MPRFHDGSLWHSALGQLFQSYSVLSVGCFVYDTITQVELFYLGQESAVERGLTEEQEKEELDQYLRVIYYVFRG